MFLIKYFCIKEQFLSTAVIVGSNLSIKYTLICKFWSGGCLTIFKAVHTLFRSTDTILNGHAEQRDSGNPIPRLRVERVDGGLMVAGVEVASSCQRALPISGCIFLVIGTVLTGIILLKFYCLLFSKFA